MANKQQKTYGKLKLKTGNGGASPLISVLEHGADAFLKPEQAIKRLKERGSRSWKVTKRHPNNVEIGKRR
jgi:hypothetical protein